MVPPTPGEERAGVWAQPWAAPPVRESPPPSTLEAQGGGRAPAQQVLVGSSVRFFGKSSCKNRTVAFIGPDRVLGLLQVRTLRDPMRPQPRRVQSLRRPHIMARGLGLSPASRGHPGPPSCQDPRGLEADAHQRPGPTGPHRPLTSPGRAKGPARQRRSPPAVREEPALLHPGPSVL